jgi:hypothetical protein
LVSIRPAANAAADAGLLQVRGRVEFAHPLARSAIYRAAAADDRQRVHLALAEATDPHTDPDRRAWHFALAASGSDEGVAAELERCAGQAQRRGGLAAAAAFLTRATELTADSIRRAERALAAAQTQLNAGEIDAARGLSEQAGAVAVDELQRARLEQLRGQIDAAETPGHAAPIRLLRAAKRIESLDSRLARETTPRPGSSTPD